MTNLLVPTDFTPASLKLAEQAVKVLNHEVNIILFHAFDLPFFYADLIRPERQPWHELLNDDLRQACKQIKERHPGLISSISFGFMQGNTNALFRNWIEANEIDVIACPAGYTYTKIHNLSLNPLPFFKKSRIKLLQNFTSPKAVTKRSQEKYVQTYPIESV
jgi:hypothetical protein